MCWAPLPFSARLQQGLWMTRSRGRGMGEHVRVGNVLLLDLLDAEAYDAPTCEGCRTVLAEAGRCAGCS